MIKTALIGGGYWGPNLARVLLATSELQWICDVNPDVLDVKFSSQQFKHIQKTTDSEDVLEDSQVEAVFIATPPETHYDLAKSVISKRKHVFVEKPMTHDSRQAKELVRLATKARVKLGVGHVFLYSEPVIKVKQLLVGSDIDQPDIGEVKHVSMTRQNLGRFQAGCDVIYDLAPHDISMLLYWFPDFEIQSAVVSLFQHDARLQPDTAYVGIRTPGGMTVSLNYSWIYPKKIREVIIVGDKRGIVYDDGRSDEPVRIYDKGIFVASNDFGGFICNYRSGDVSSPLVKIKEPLMQEVRAFLDWVEIDEPILNDGENGYQVVRIMEKIKEFS